MWGVTQGQLKQQAGIDGKALNVEQSLDDLKIALGAVVAFSAIAAVGSGLASKQLTELITPLYCSVAVHTHIEYHQSKSLRSVICSSTIDVLRYQTVATRNKGRHLASLYFWDQTDTQDSRYDV